MEQMTIIMMSTVIEMEEPVDPFELTAAPYRED